MKRLLLFFAVWLVCLHAYAFPVRTNLAYVTYMGAAGAAFQDFRFQSSGYEDQTFQIVFSNQTFSGVSAAFKVSRSVSTGKISYILVDAADITAASNSFTWSLHRTNVPPDAVYQCELWVFSGSTNQAVSAARGTWRVTDSLYDDDDSAFPWPTNTADLVNYLTVTGAAATYVQKAGGLTQFSAVTNAPTDGYTLVARISAGVTNYAFEAVGAAAADGGQTNLLSNEPRLTFSNSARQTYASFDVGGLASNITLSGGILSTTNIGTGNVYDVQLTTNALREAMTNTFLAIDTTSGGDMSGPWSNMQFVAGSVSNADVASNASIAPSKIANTALVGTNVFLGHVSGVHTALGLQVDAVASSNILAYSIATADIATGAVTTAQILDETVTSADVADDTLTWADFLFTEIAGSNVAAGTLNGSDIADGSISNIDLAVDAVAGSNIVDGTIGTADAALTQWDARYLMQTGGALSGRANISGSAQGTNILTLRNTATPGAGLDVEANSSANDYMARFSRGSTVEYAFYPTWADFGGNNLRNVNAITSLYYIGDGAGVTSVDAETIDGEDSTNLTLLATFRALNNSVVTTTNPRAQRVLGDLHGATFAADQGVVAACTNCAMSTNMIVNGDMTRGGAYWTFTGGANSNSGSGGQLIVAGNTSGTAVQSNQFAATPGTWILSYTNTATDATGSITVAWGGVEHTQVGSLTGYVSWPVGPRTTNGFSISASVTGSTAGAWKNFTLKQVFSGDVTGVYGSFTHLAASNARIAGSLTAETISGTASGYVAKIGDTMTGTLLMTNSAGTMQVLGSGTQLDTTNNTQGHIINGGNGSALYSSGYILWTKSTNLIYLTIKGSNAPYFARLAGGLNPTVTNEIWDDGNRSTGYTLVAYNAANLTNSPVPGPGTVAPITNARCAGCSIIMDTGATSAFWGQISASVTGVTDVGVTVTHTTTNYTGGTNLLVTLAGIDARLGSKLGTSNDSVTSAHIQGGAIGNAEMAASAVAQSNILANSIGASRMMVTNAHAAGYVLKSSDSNTFYWAADGGADPVGAAYTASNNTYTAGTTQTMDVAKFTGGFILGGVLVTNVSTNAASATYTNIFAGGPTTGAVTTTSTDTGKFLNAAGSFVTPGYPSGSGGGTNGLVLIASYVADDTTNRVEFAAIPQTYKTLILMGGLWERGEATWDSGSVNGAPIVLRPNNNTNAVYDWTRTFLTGGSRTDGTLNNYPYIYASYGTSTTNGWCSFRTRFDNYTMAGVAKAIDSEWTVASYASPPTMTYQAGEFRGGVRDMNPITSIVVYAISGTNWNRGRVDLYGVQ